MHGALPRFTTARYLGIHCTPFSGFPWDELPVYLPTVTWLIFMINVGQYTPGSIWVRFIFWRNVCQDLTWLSPSSFSITFHLDNSPNVDASFQITPLHQQQSPPGLLEFYIFLVGNPEIQPSFATDLGGLMGCIVKVFTRTIYRWSLYTIYWWRGYIQSETLTNNSGADSKQWNTSWKFRFA